MVIEIIHELIGSMAVHECYPPANLHDNSTLLNGSQHLLFGPAIGGCEIERIPHSGNLLLS